LQVLVCKKGEIIAYKDAPCSKIMIIMEGTIVGIQDHISHEYKWVDLGDDLTDKIFFTQENLIGKDCLEYIGTVQEHTYVCYSNFCYIITLSKKDFTEVLLQSRKNEELGWKTFMNSLDFVSSMPYYLHVEILKLIFK